MRPKELVRELLEIVARCGVEVRHEQGRFRGGYCLLRRRPVIVLNRALPPEQLQYILAEALQHLPLEQVPMKPAVRAWLEAFRQPPHGKQGSNVSSVAVDRHERG